MDKQDLIPRNETDLGQSVPPPAFSTNFASLSLHEFDRIRLLKFPLEITDLIRRTIISSWPRGIQAERLYATSYEFKLRGNPWLGSGDDAMYACRLLQQIFMNLFEVGWLLSMSTDVSKKVNDKDSLIFRHQTPAPEPSDWMSITFSKDDRLRFLNAPQDLLDAVVSALQLQVQSSMLYTKMADREAKFNGAPSSVLAKGTMNTWEVKLQGFPWRATGEATMTARLIVLELVTVLERFGFTVYASVDNTGSSCHEADTWHCRRPRDWASGAPVYHR